MELERGENMDKSIDTAEKFDNIQTVAEEFLEKPGGIREKPGGRGPRKATLVEALFTFGFLIVVMSVSILTYSHE